MRSGGKEQQAASARGCNLGFQLVLFLILPGFQGLLVWNERDFNSLRGGG